MYQISVACGCDIGRVRARNEDNIYLNGRTLEQNNRGLKGILTAKYLLDTEKCFAVFDGMGGEQAGDAAAFTAARALRAGQERLQEYGTPYWSESQVSSDDVKLVSTRLLYRYRLR